MPGSSHITGLESIVFVDNMSLDGTERGGALSSNGQLWIGSTSGRHVRVGQLTSLDGSITITNGPGTIDLVSTGSAADLHTAEFIVNSEADKGGNYFTITAALAAASSGDTIFVMPGATGTYTENLTLKAGVNITSFVCDGETPNVTIIGKCSFASAGTVTISNLRLQTTSDNFLAVTGSAASIVNLNNCYLNASNNTGISFTTASASARINLFDCTGNLGTTGIGMWANSATGLIDIVNCNFTNTGGSSTASSSSAGTVNISDSALDFVLTYTSTGVGTHINAIIDTSAVNTACVTLSNTTTLTSYNSVYLAGTASAISIGAGCTCNLYGSTITSSNTNALTGAGTINYTGLSLTNSKVINTTTQAGGVLTGLTNSSPAVGFVGETIRGYRGASDTLSLTTATPANITSIDLTPGVWDVSGIVWVNQATAGAGVLIYGSINSTSATISTNTGDQSGSNIPPLNNTYDCMVCIPAFRVSITATTTYYLVGQANFTSGTMTAVGRISGTRVS